MLVPPHRMTPLKQNWMALYTPVVEQLKLDIRCGRAAERPRVGLVQGGAGCPVVWPSSTV